VDAKQNRATRHPFAAAIEVTDIRSEKQVTTRTRDLSVFGCFAETTKPFPRGTLVRLRIHHGTAKISVRGRIVYVRAGEGMGIVFSGIEPRDQAILDRWLAEMRDR
jgi:hypothetical protein